MITQTQAVQEAGKVLWLSDIEAKPVEWLNVPPIGEGWLARRYVSLLDADPYIGKTTLLIWLAAWASRNGAVAVLACAEDDPVNTIKPRILAAGGDSKRIALVPTARQTAHAS